MRVACPLAAPAIEGHKLAGFEFSELVGLDYVTGTHLRQVDRRLPSALLLVVCEILSPVAPTRFEISSRAAWSFSRKTICTSAALKMIAAVPIAPRM